MSDIAWLPSDQPPAGSRERRGLGIVLIVGAVLAVMVIALFWWPGWLARYVLDADAVERAVAAVVGVEASAVSCPAGESATRAHTFTCSVTSTQQTVLITVQGTATGAYRIG